MTIEPNYVEIGLGTNSSNSSGFAIDATPESNTPPVPASTSNVTPAPNGSILNGGSFYSPNFSKGNSGWFINAAGDVEFNSGTFRGALVANSLDIPDTTTANSFHVNTAGDAWWGATAIGSAVAKVLKTGVATFTDVVATGTMNATGGYVGTTTALVYESTGINTGTTGHIRGGQTAYNTGTGFFLGYESAAYKFSIGDGGTTYYLTWDGSTLVVNGSPVLNQDIFGDGSDGDVTISGATSLARDMYYGNLTVNTGITLNSNGFRIFVKNTLNTVGTGKIASNGNAGGVGGDPPGGNPADNGVGGSAGAIAYSTGTLPIPLVGKAGGDGGDSQGAQRVGVAGSNGTDQAKAVGNTDAVAGGVGGTSGAFAGGNGGTAGVKTGSILAPPRAVVSAYNLFDLAGGTITQFGVAPSGSGGGGGASGVANTTGGGGGGGSGSSGGVVWIAARLVTNATVEAKGGVGGNGGNHVAGQGGTGGVGGGGAGGNGGAIIFLYSKLTASSLSAAGGAGGTKGTTGSTTNATDGATGNAGITVSLQV